MKVVFYKYNNIVLHKCIERIDNSVLKLALEYLLLLKVDECEFVAKKWG